MLTLVLDLTLLSLVTAAAVKLAYAVPPQPMRNAAEESAASAVHRDAIRSIGYNL